MALPKRSIVVSQRYNADFNSMQPACSENREFVFLVERAVNTMEVRIGEVLTEDRVQSLIDHNVAVTIQSVKG